MSTPADQDAQGVAIQQESNVRPENSIRKDRIYTVEDPFLGEDIPKPEGDPFEAFLKTSLERDSRQCEAWKDEVQNILIFAGLFSAVITAFIIESYQRLQPDPNNEVVMLLARISDQLASSPNNTTVPLIPNANAPFTPLHSDIRINIFWFISLVLSLTVALIGIITLQWLREHQRYDSSMDTMEAFGILNMRSECLQRWYVPQIFAVLPLLLQGALVLFFVGLVDFLFAIRIDVAIPVTVSLGIPLLFLVATTLLPTLQLYTLEFPHILSMNYRVPSPCPYKSPQSLITRRVAIFSQTFFRVCTYIFTAIYAPFVGIIRMFVTAQRPFYGKFAPFYGNISGGFNGVVSFPRDFFRWVDTRDWMSIDRHWLPTRTAYAIVVNTPQDFRDTSPNQDDDLFAWDSLHSPSGFYDCLEGLYNTYSTKLNFDAHYHGVEALFEKLCSSWDNSVRNCGHKGNIEHHISLMRGRYTAVMDILFPISETLPPTNYLSTRPGEVILDSKALHNAYRANLMGQILFFGAQSDDHYKISQRWIESQMRFITPYLLESTQQLFECKSTEILPRKWMIYILSYANREVKPRSPAWMNDISRQWTLIFSDVIQNSSQLNPSKFGARHISLEPCDGDVENDSVKDLMRYILAFQVHDDIKHTLQLLNHYCTSVPNPISDQPYILVITCTYLNAVAAAQPGFTDGVEYHTLLETVSSICGHQTKSLIKLTRTEFDTSDANALYWEGFEDALAYIRDNQTLGHNQARDSQHFRLPFDHQEIKAPDNV